MHKAEQDGCPVVDVDGSYMYKKFKSLNDTGIPAAMPTGLPPPPISGCSLVNEDTCLSSSTSIPPVTSGERTFFVNTKCFCHLHAGVVYAYLAGHITD